MDDATFLTFSLLLSLLIEMDDATFFFGETFFVRDNCFFVWV